MRARLRAFCHRADAWTFAPLDPRAAAWLRLALAAALPFFFWTPPTAPAHAGASPFLTSLYDVVVASDAHRGVVAILCLALALGLRARLVCVSLLALLLPLSFSALGHVSRPILLFSLLAFAFVRSDAVRWPWRTAPAGAAAGPAWPVRLMQVQLSVLYGVNAVAKTTPEYWSGDALMAMSIAFPNFLQDLTTGVVTLGPLTMPVAVAGVLSCATEYGLAVGFWLGRWRWAAAAVGVGFHAVLTRIVAIHMLDDAAVFLYLTFLLPLTRRRQRVGGIPRKMDPAGLEGSN